MEIASSDLSTPSRPAPWNKGKLVGQKAPLKLRDIWAIRVRLHGCPHIGVRHYSRIVHGWCTDAGLDSPSLGTHSMRRTKVSMVYRKTGNLRAVQLLLGHTKLESTVRYLGIEVEDALEISEKIEI
ncbi:MAG: tyrosine-type recombinase/integrase [Pseudomonadota bacterium]